MEKLIMVTIILSFFSKKTLSNFFRNFLKKFGWFFKNSI